jgi:hypothetical protein
MTRLSQRKRRRDTRRSLRALSHCHESSSGFVVLKMGLSATKVRLPEVLACSGIRVATRKKLPENRKVR